MTNGKKILNDNYKIAEDIYNIKGILIAYTLIKFLKKHNTYIPFIEELKLKYNTNSLNSEKLILKLVQDTPQYSVQYLLYMCCNVKTPNFFRNYLGNLFSDWKQTIDNFPIYFQYKIFRVIFQLN